MIEFLHRRIYHDHWPISQSPMIGGGSVIEKRIFRRLIDAFEWSGRL
jgi:hypothetical protein